MKPLNKNPFFLGLLTILITTGCGPYHKSTTNWADDNTAAPPPETVMLPSTHLQLLIETPGDGVGRLVSEDHPEFECPTESSGCTLAVSYNEPIALRFVPMDPQTYFVGWQEDCSGASLACEFRADGDPFLGAIAIQRPEITVTETSAESAIWPARIQIPKGLTPITGNFENTVTWLHLGDVSCSYQGQALSGKSTKKNCTKNAKKLRFTGTCLTADGTSFSPQKIESGDFELSVGPGDYFLEVGGAVEFDIPEAGGTIHIVEWIHQENL